MQRPTAAYQHFLRRRSATRVSQLPSHGARPRCAPKVLPRGPAGPRSGVAWRLSRIYERRAPRGAASLVTSSLVPRSPARRRNPRRKSPGPSCRARRASSRRPRRRLEELLRDRSGPSSAVPGRLWAPAGSSAARPKRRRRLARAAVDLAPLRDQVPSRVSLF